MSAHGYGDLEAAANEITSLRDQLRSCRNELRSTQETVRRLQEACEERYEEGRGMGWRRAIEKAAEVADKADRDCATQEWTAETIRALMGRP